MLTPPPLMAQEVDPAPTGGASSSSGIDRPAGSAMVAVGAPQRSIEPGAAPDLIGEIRDLYGFMGPVGNGRLPKPGPNTAPELAYVFGKFKPNIAVRAETIEDLDVAPEERKVIVDDLAHQVQNKYLALMESLPKVWKSVIFAAIVGSMSKRT